MSPPFRDKDVAPLAKMVLKFFHDRKPKSFFFGIAIEW